MAQYPLATVLAVAIPLGTFCFLAIVLVTVLSTRYQKYAKAEKRFKTVGSKPKQRQGLEVFGTTEIQATILKDSNPLQLKSTTNDQDHHLSLNIEDSTLDLPRGPIPSTVSSMYSTSTLSGQHPLDFLDTEDFLHSLNKPSHSRQYPSQMYPKDNRSTKGKKFFQNMVRSTESLSPFQTESDSSHPVLLPAIPITDHNTIGQHIYQKIVKKISDQQELEYKQSHPEQRSSFKSEQDFDFENSATGSHTRPVWIKSPKEPKTPERKSPRSSKFKSLDHSVGNSPAGPLPNISPPKPPGKGNSVFQTSPKALPPFSSSKSNLEFQIPVFPFRDYSNFGSSMTGSATNNSKQISSPLTENDGLIVNLQGANIVADTPYQASLSDELDIDVGDCLQVYEVFDDGWCKASIVLSDNPIETKRIIHGVCPMSSLDLRPTPFGKKS